MKKTTDENDKELILQQRVQIIIQLTEKRKTDTR